MFEKLKMLSARLDELEMRLSAPDLYDDPARAARLLRERNELEPIVEAYRAYERAQQQLADATEMLSDPDMKELAQEELQQAKSDIMPLSMCVAMSQGYIGYDLQNMIGEELDRRGLGIHCATVLTQVAVDPADPAFQHPTKPIGAFMTEEEAKKLAAEKGIDVAEDAGRGWRQVVASPRPKEIVEIATVKALMNAKHAVIAAGGGGIPGIWEDQYHLKGVPAVIDKDFASECMAEQLDADMLIILTAVDAVCVNYNKPDQKELSSMTIADCEKYIAEGQFAPGSMLPKVESCMEFVKNNDHGGTALITSLARAADALEGKTGTVITR